MVIMGREVELYPEWLELFNRLGGKTEFGDDEQTMMKVCVGCKRVPQTEEIMEFTYAQKRQIWWWKPVSDSAGYFRFPCKHWKSRSEAMVGGGSTVGTYGPQAGCPYIVEHAFAKRMCVFPNRLDAPWLFAMLVTGQLQLTFMDRVGVFLRSFQKGSLIEYITQDDIVASVVILSRMLDMAPLSRKEESNKDFHKGCAAFRREQPSFR